MEMIEKSTRLSESLLWGLQRAFYSKQGSQAWSKAIVPSYATSNPFTVRQYVQLTVAFLRDGMAQNSPSPIDLSQPVHIFDLGAGSGQCAYLFLKDLLNQMEVHSLRSIRLRYVMTDIAENNLLFLVKHPFLKPYFQAGVLDVAYYDHTFHQEPIHLFLSKIPIDKTLNPSILICNYFFDTLPQDLFRVRDGQLEEGRVSLFLDGEEHSKSFGSLDPDMIPYLRLEYDYHPISDPKTYYPDCPEWNAILQTYQEQLEGQFFLLPIGGLQAMRYFSWLTQNRLLVLVGDHGPCHLEQLRKQSQSWMTRHGNFSLTVNFEAIFRYFSALHGIGLLPTEPDPFFVIGTFLLGGMRNDFPETAFAYQEYIDSFQMRDYWKLVAHAQEEWKDPSIEQLLLLIKFGNWDPLLFQLFIDKIRDRLLDLSEAVREALCNAIDRIWDHFYPIDKEKGEFASRLGELLLMMERYPQAIAYFERSLEITGYQPETYLKMGASYLGMQDKDSAWACYRLAKVGMQDE